MHGVLLSVKRKGGHLLKTENMFIIYKVKNLNSCHLKHYFAF